MAKKIKGSAKIINIRTTAIKPGTKVIISNPLQRINKTRYIKKGSKPPPRNRGEW